MWIVSIYIVLAVLLFLAPEALKDNIGLETLDAAYPSVSNIDRMVPIKIPNANIGEGASQSVSPIDAGKESEENKLKKSDGSSAIKERDAGPP